MLCLEVLRRFWSLPTLDLYAKSGEEQNGIDILDLGGEIPLRAAQCKLKEADKSLSPGEIEVEVEKARAFELAIGKYAILTTGKVSGQSQRKILEINQLHKSQGLFEVELFTWDRLSRLLQTYPEIFEQFYGDGLAPNRAARIESTLTNMQVTIRDGFETLTGKETGNGIDAQIDEARDYLATGDFQITTTLLNRLERNHGAHFTLRHKFRIASNHGAAALATGQVGLAAKYFLEAVAHQPDDEQALTNEVLAYMLVGDITQSHRRAEALRIRFPASGRLTAFWIGTAPQVRTANDLEADVNSILRKDAEVALALGRRALSEKQFDLAEKYGAIAKEVRRWSQPHLLAAQIAMGRALLGDFGLGGTPKECIQSAEAYCSEALTIAHEEKDRYAIIGCLGFRADIWLMLGQPDKALVDAKQAERIDAEDVHVLLAIAQSMAALGKHDEAVEGYRKAYRLHHRSDIAFLLSRALRGRGRSGDSDEALEVLRQVSLVEVRPDLRTTYAMEIVQLHVRKRDWAGARSYLQSSADLLRPETVLVCEGSVSHSEGNLEKAAELAQNAARGLTAESDRETKEYLASLFMLIGRPDEALPLWKGAFIAGREGFDPANYLNCAVRLRRDDLVMEACGILRARGKDTWDLLEFELQYLRRYKIEKAIEILQSFISQHPEHRVARLHLSLIAASLNRTTLVKASLTDLPSVDELPIELAVPAIVLLRQHGSQMDAVTYAYDYLRTHFQDLKAHRALIMAVMGGALPELPPTIEVVERGAAVCYQELPDGRPIWVVIEDTTQPNAEFEEIELGSERAQALLGRRIGDTIVLAKGSVQDRRACILQVLPKYVRRFQDSMEQLQIRFGPASGVESLRIIKTEEDPAGLKPLLTSVEQRASSVERLNQLYKDQPMPLHVLGSEFGQNAYVALAELARQPEIGIKCCQGTPEERQSAEEGLETARVVVADLTALCTLRILGLLEVLKSSKRFQFIVAERTIIELNQMLTGSTRVTGDSLAVAFRDGKHIGYKTTAETRDELRRSDEDFVRFVETHLTQENAPTVAALEPEKRESLHNILGEYGTESVLLAARPDRILWTDDMIQGQIGAQEFGINRVWTQLVLESLVVEGVLSVNEYSIATASLVGMNFLLTLFNAESIVAAFRTANWSAEDFPVPQFRKVLSEAPEEVFWRLFLDVIRILFREALILPEQRCMVVSFLIDLFWPRPMAETRLTELKQLAVRMFGLNVVGSAEFQRCLDRWVNLKRNPIILAPD